MKRKKFLCALILGVVWLLPSMSAVAEKWPIKEFKVFQKKPGTLLASPNMVSDDVAREIERWLKTVAQEYESMGFKKPNFSHIDKSFFNNKQAYKVYVYPDNRPGAAHAAMLHPCGKTPSGQWVKIPTFMKVNSLLSVKNGKLTTKAYQDMAHELFHAVQNSYDLFTGNCDSDPGDWIREGTAEALGIEMERKLYPWNQPNHICQMGIRSYSERLYVPTRNIIDSHCKLPRGYQTQSFWQFLGEYNAHKWASGKYIATPEFIEPDYRYLINFFNTTHAMGSRSKEYAWLDKVLRQSKHHGRNQFGISLHKAYSRFAGTFASYGNKERRKLYKMSSFGVTEKKWIEKIFGICKEYMVNKGQTAPSLPVTLHIGPVASRCLKVDFSGFSGSARTRLTFFLTGNNPGIEPNSLSISTNGGKMIVRHDPVDSNPNKIGTFPIVVKPGTSQYFIVSNVEENAGNTISISPEIEIIADFVSSSTAKAKKKNQTKENPTNLEELDNAWESRSWKGVVRQKEKRPCSLLPFEARPCGSITEIDLQLVSDAGQLLDAGVEPSLSLERRMNIADAFVKRGEEQLLTDIPLALQEIRKLDGWQIDISLPQIQPGFAGSLSNAHIIVKKAYKDGKPNGSYSAVGPWVGPCPPPSGGYYPANGKVTITEFSRNVLRGTFSAKLVDARETCGGVSVARSIQEEFIITTIRWGKTLPPPEVSDSDLIDRQVEDVNELIPGLIPNEMQEFIKDKARKERQKQKQSKQENSENKKKASEFQQCHCTCEMETKFCAANPEADCCVSCEPLFNACKGNQKSSHEALTTEEQAQEDTEVHAMRQQYEAYLESVGASGDMKIQMMDAFDQMKTEQKKMLMMSIPRK